jgi:ribonuclease Z
LRSLRPTATRLATALAGGHQTHTPLPEFHWTVSTLHRLQSTKSDGDFGLIYKPPNYTIDSNDEVVSNSIRSCLSGYNQEDHDYYTRDTGMSLCFFGTSAGIPTRHRSTTATLLRLGGSSFLFDAGEGVQRQLAFTRAKPSHIERIFITHLHGDHIFGLPGFLLGLQHSVMMMQNESQTKKQHRKERGEHVVKIYGPPGLYNFIASNITLSCTKFHSLSIEVYELVGGRVRRSHGGRGIRNPFHDTYPEFNFGFIKRKFIESENGVWNIHDFRKRTRQDVLSETLVLAAKRKVRIKAAELDHLPGIATFGFVIEEDEPARNIDADRAKELGVSPNGKKYDLLKFGFSVQTDDGSREVRPEEVLKPRTKRARKVAILGDNRAWTPQMADIAKNADVLIHEATLTEEDYSVSRTILIGGMMLWVVVSDTMVLFCSGVTQLRPRQVRKVEMWMPKC